MSLPFNLSRCPGKQTEVGKGKHGFRLFNINLDKLFRVSAQNES